MSDLPHRPPPAFLSRQLSFWQLQLSGWFLFALVTLPMKQLVYDSLSASLLITAYQFPLSLVLTGILRLFYRRSRPADRSFWSAVGLVFGACTVANSIDILVSMPANHYIGVTGPAHLTEPGLYVFRGTIYLAWSLLYLLIKATLASRQQAFHTAVADEKLRLEAIRYQLNPQFLANSLLTIAHEIDQDPAIARAMTTRLTNFYRTALRQTETDQATTVGEELELLRAYLEIERLRLGRALSVHYQVDDTLLGLPLPPLLLLPLAEKAVKHGAAYSPERFEIKVTAQRTPEGEVLLEIARTGRLHDSPEPTESAGPDLLNLRARLERYYPGRHRFVLTQDSARVRATLCLPLQG
jgi:hypothetical protein